MNAECGDANRILIMGIGNTLLQDDGAGVHVAQSLKSKSESVQGVTVLDGGTLGMSLLPEIENASCLIVVDAGEFGEEPGEIRVFEGEEMDHRLSGMSSTVHELAMSDLLSAATLTGNQPKRRALVAIQPLCCEWGLEPTDPVRDAIPRARAVVDQLVGSWAA